MVELQKGEVIRPVPGYEEFYSASNFGRVFSNSYRMTGRMQELAQSILIDKRRTSSSHYRRAKMFRINPKTPTAVHRVIALTFIDNPRGLNCVNHKDGDKGNNRADNLEWCTNAENLRHAESTGLANHPTGERHPMAKLTDQQVIEIKTIMAKVPKYQGQGRDLGNQFGVSLYAISDIRTGKSWTHI